MSGGGPGGRGAGGGPSAGARLHVDWTACEGRGVCSELLPHLLEVDPWGYPVPAPERDGAPQRWSREAGLAVPPEDVPDARQAVRQCPRLALHLDAAAARRPGRGTGGRG